MPVSLQSGLPTNRADIKLHETLASALDGLSDLDIAGYQFSDLTFHSTAPHLTVMFSPSPSFFFLRRLKIPGCSFGILDRDGHYFIRRPDAIAEAIERLLDRAGLNSVHLIGHSKGGFGALLSASILARLRPNIGVNVVAFSPQIQLWPKNRRLKYPSYKNLLLAAKTDPDLMDDLQAFGDVPARLRNLQNVSGTVVYGKSNREDSREAARLRGVAGFTTVGVPTRQHLAILPFVVDVLDDAAVNDAVARQRLRADDDVDVTEAVGSRRILRVTEDFRKNRLLFPDRFQFWDGIYTGLSEASDGSPGYISLQRAKRSPFRLPRLLKKAFVTIRQP